MMTRRFARCTPGCSGGQGYSVDQADDRASATAAVAKRAYAVVLLDLMLPPDGTSQGGIAQLKAVLSQRPETKVIVVSGAGTQETEKASTGTLLEQIEALERREIERALTTHHGNRTHAAEALGLSRQGLLKKMERYGFN